MNRRGFLCSLVGGVVAGAAVRTFPFRVYSFPENILIRRGLGDIEWNPKELTWEMNNEQLAAVQALELETFRKEIPELLSQDMYRYLSKRWRTVEGLLK